MKNNKPNRVRQNGLKNSVPKQAEKPALKSGKFIAVVILRDPSGKEHCRFDLEDPLFAAVKRAATRQQISLPKFFSNAIARLLSLTDDRSIHVRFSNGKEGCR